MYHFVNVEDEAGQHVVAFAVNTIILLLNVEFSEKVEGDDRVNVYDNDQQHDGQEKLLSVMSDGLQDGPQGSHGHSYIQQMSGKEKVVEIAQNRERKVEERVEERVVCDGHSSFPYLFI